LALRFWMRAELVSEFLDSGRPNDIFRHAASGRADRPRR
jgi:hypothetical protein